LRAKSVRKVRVVSGLVRAACAVFPRKRACVRTACR